MTQDDLIDYLTGRIDGCRLPEEYEDAIRYAHDLEVLREAEAIRKKYTEDDG